MKATSFTTATPAAASAQEVFSRPARLAGMAEHSPEPATESNKLPGQMWDARLKQWLPSAMQMRAFTLSVRNVWAAILLAGFMLCLGCLSFFSQRVRTSFDSWLDDKFGTR